jgi:hypothetical protein
MSANNTLHTVLIDNQQKGLAALKDGLNTMDGQSNRCPFVNRCGLNFPEEFGVGGNNDTDDMDNDDDDMTELGLFPA